MQNTGNQYRLQKITEIQKQLEAEKQKRTQLGEKYKKGVNAVDVIDYVLASSNCGTKHLRHWSFSYYYCCTCSHYHRNDYDGCRNAVHTK